MENTIKKKIIKKPAGKDPPQEAGNQETVINESNFKKIYENFGTQEELYSLKEKKVEGFEGYFELLEEGLLGKIETSLDVPTSIKRKVIVIKINN